MMSRTQARDTSVQAEAVVVAGLRQMPPWRKLEMMCAMTRASEQLSLAGLRLRHPLADDRELRLRQAALRFDRETMIKVYGWDPEAPV